MSWKTREYEVLEETGCRLVEELHAILDEHLPPEMAKAAKGKIEAFQDNTLGLAEHADKRLYRALMGFMPEHASQIRAAFHGVIFEGCVMDERDWPDWERGVFWPITPDLTDALNDRDK